MSTNIIYFCSVKNVSMESANHSHFELSNLMREIIRIFKNRISELEDDSIKITHEQFALLRAISMKEEEVIQKDLAEIMGKDKSAILRIIDTLEEKNLIRRVVDKNDRRKNYLMITKFGDHALKVYYKIGEDMLSDINKGLSEDDLNTFNRIVMHMKNNAINL